MISVSVITIEDSEDGESRRRSPNDEIDVCFEPSDQPEKNAHIENETVAMHTKVSNNFSDFESSDDDATAKVPELPVTSANRRASDFLDDSGFDELAENGNT